MNNTLNYICITYQITIHHNITMITNGRMYSFRDYVTCWSMYTCVDIMHCLLKLSAVLICKVNGWPTTVQSISQFWVAGGPEISNTAQQKVFVMHFLS